MADLHVDVDRDRDADKDVDVRVRVRVRAMHVNQSELELELELSLFNKRLDNSPLNCVTIYYMCMIFAIQPHKAPTATPRLLAVAPGAVPSAWGRPVRLGQPPHIHSHLPRGWRQKAAVGTPLD